MQRIGESADSSNGCSTTPRATMSYGLLPTELSSAAVLPCGTVCLFTCNRDTIRYDTISYESLTCTERPTALR